MKKYKNTILLLNIIAGIGILLILLLKPSTYYVILPLLLVLIGEIIRRKYILKGKKHKYSFFNSLLTFLACISVYLYINTQNIIFLVIIVLIFIIGLAKEYKEYN